MLVDRIYKHYEARNDEPPRAYLGASQLGAECERATWYGYRWVKPSSFGGRMLRLFETGHLAEIRFAGDLEAVGINVNTIDPNTGEQFRAVALEQHFSGSMDGIATGIDEKDPDKKYILEFKTHNEKSFNLLVKVGVENSKWQHYVQMQVYMGLFDIHQALYLAVNKNNDELYSEIVEFNREKFNLFMEKAKRIIVTSEPPAKLNNSPSFFKCKMCDYKDICHNGSSAAVNCRTCVHSGPAKGGMWKCRKYNRVLDVDMQAKGCPDHDPIT